MQQFFRRNPAMPFFEQMVDRAKLGDDGAVVPVRFVQPHNDSTGSWLPGGGASCVSFFL